MNETTILVSILHRVFYFDVKVKGTRKYKYNSFYYRIKNFKCVVFPVNSFLPESVEIRKYQKSENITTNFEFHPQWTS